MAYPEHPNTFVIRNKYYSRGLSELDVWNHYKKHKNNIVKEIDLRGTLLFIFPEMNKWVVKRNHDNRIIRLDKHNYDDFISGRTVSLSVERAPVEDYICVDVDGGNHASENNLKDAVTDLLNSSLQKMSTRTRVTNSAEGYHVYFHLDKAKPIKVLHQVLKRILDSEFSDKYILGNKPPSGNEIKLDTTPTRNRGSHTVPYALCRNGLMCMDITKIYDKFDRKKAIVT